jgi:hypothetical protein
MTFESDRVKRREYGSGHAYQRRDGRGWTKLDGVTTLLREGMPKPALVEWAAKTVAAAAVERWDELGDLPPDMRVAALSSAHRAQRNVAAAKGSEIHRLAEALSAGVEVDVPDELVSHVNSAVAFMDDWQIQPVATESVVYSLTHNYGGTFDMVATTPWAPGECFLLDWKTSASGIYDETALQLAAYRHAEFFIDSAGKDCPISQLGITDTWAVWIRDDGYSVYPMASDIDVFGIFLDVAAVARDRAAMKDAPLKGGMLPNGTDFLALSVVRDG